MKAILLLAATAAVSLAQSECNSVHRLAEDIAVYSALYVDGELQNVIGPNDKGLPLCRFENGPGFFRRLMDLPSGKTFGYEVHVSRNPAGPKPYHVKVTPVQGSSSTMYFPRGPDPVDIDSSETIEFALFVLETRKNTARLVERLQVNDGKSPPTVFHHSENAIAPASTPIALTKPTLSRLDGKGLPVTSAGTVRGSSIWLYIPDLGRVWLSSRRQPGFESTLPVKGTDFDFRWDGIDYHVASAAPIIDLPGDWSVWMRLERDWKPSSLKGWTIGTGLVMGVN